MKCPFCQNSFHEAWTPVVLQTRPDGDYVARSLVCPECGEVLIGLQRFIENSVAEEHLVWPKYYTRPVPSEVDQRFADDFREASAVVSISPKASAALSRRCLQDILREKAGVQARDLDKEIQQVIDSKATPS